MCIYTSAIDTESIDASSSSASLPYPHPGELCVFAHGNQAGFNYLNVVILTYAKRSNFKRQLPVRVLLFLFFLFEPFILFLFSTILFSLLFLSFSVYVFFVRFSNFFKT